jgi:hypothetical protein
MAQALAFWRVRQSNLHILKEARAITQAGWLSIPCGPALAGLSTFKAAFWGGLFFTLSIGAGLCLATWVVLLAIGQNGLRDWFGRMVVALLWVLLLLTVNYNGLLIWGSLFIILTPLAFGWVYLKYRSDQRIVGPRYLRLIAPAALLLLAALWFSQYSSGLFLKIRDQLLLSNSAGRSINTFYYRYTLYAAEAVKSFDQKTVRTCSLSGVQDPQLARRLVQRLIELNVLPLHDFQPADVAIREVQGQLVLQAHGSAALTVPIQAFENDTGSWLMRFSAQSDRYGGLRSLIIASLVLAFPVLIFIIAYGFLQMFAGLFVKPVAAAWLATGLCFCMGGLLLVPIQSTNLKIGDQADLMARLQSHRRTDHLAALRFMELRKIEPSTLPPYERFLDRKSVV